MKILFQFSNYSIRYNYSCWEKLIQLNNNIEIGLFGSSEYGDKFLSRKKKIYKKYIPLSLSNFKPTGDIDYKKLNEFEIDLMKISKDNIWKIIAYDRALGHSYSHGLVGYKFKNSNNREYILEFFCKLIKNYEIIFNNFKPDIFIPALAMGDIGAKILEIICKKRNIKYLLPESTRIENYISFADDININFPQIEAKINKNLNIENISYTNEVNELFYKLKNNFTEEYFDKKNNTRALSEYKYKNYFLNYFYILFVRLFLKISYDTVLFFLKIIKLNFNFKFYKEIREYFKRIKNRFLIAKQKVFLSNKKNYDKFNKDYNYIYYPLMAQPEYGINVLGTIWMDQINLIESISKNLPYDWYLYVKEHPSLLNDRIRPKGFYKKIKSIPNIKFIDIKIDSDQIISNSNGVFVISGTTGFEAIFANKPVFETRKNLWSNMGLSKKCINFENFHFDILNETKRINDIPLSKKNKILLSYISSIIEESIPMKYPDVFFYDRNGSDEENKVCGIQLGEFIYKIICDNIKK